MPDLTSRAFGLQDLVIEVASDHADDLAWLGEFLGPAFCTTPALPAGRPALRLTLTRDDAILHQWNPSLTEPAVAYVLDNGPLLLPRQPRDAGAITLDAEFSTWYREVSSGVALVDVLGHTRPDDGLPRRARIPLMRAVREVAMHALRRQGRILLHASSVARDGRAVAFAGMKTAGKTSLLTAALALVEGTALLANDRIALQRGTTGWLATGIASIVSVRAGMLDILPMLRAQLVAAAGGITHRAGATVPPRVRDDGGIGLNPLQYARALNTTVVASAQLATIAFPCLDPAQGGVTAVALGKDEAAARLWDALFSAGALASRSQLFDVPDAGPWPSAEEQAGMVTALAGSVRCVELRVGPNAYRPEVLAPVIDTLLR